jgi:hypothetical protein
MKIVTTSVNQTQKNWSRKERRKDWKAARLNETRDGEDER